MYANVLGDASFAYFCAIYNAINQLGKYDDIDYMLNPIQCLVLICVGVSTTWVLELKNTAGFLHGTCVLCSSLHVDETSQRLGRSSLSCALVEFPSVESKQKPPGALSEVTGSPAVLQYLIKEKRDKWKTVGFGNTPKHKLKARTHRDEYRRALFTSVF